MVSALEVAFYGIDIKRRTSVPDSIWLEVASDKTVVAPCVVTVRGDDTKWR